MFERDRDDANVFCEGSPWGFQKFDQLPCFLCDMRYPDSAGWTKIEEEPIASGHSQIISGLTLHMVNVSLRQALSESTHVADDKKRREEVTVRNSSDAVIEN